MIPIGDRAAAWVEKYIRESRPQLVVEPDDHTVFLSNAGEPFCLDHLSDLVRTYVDAANIGKRGACHGACKGKLQLKVKACRASAAPGGSPRSARHNNIMSPSRRPRPRPGRLVCARPARPPPCRGLPTKNKKQPELSFPLAGKIAASG